MNRKRQSLEANEYYKIGDKVEAIKSDIGAWFSADIIGIHPNSKCQCVEHCHCTYKLLFEGDDDCSEAVDRKLDEIRQVTYSSIKWDNLKIGMKVVVNYNIDKPQQWGYWYDYVISSIIKRGIVTYVKGTLLVGYSGTLQKIPVEIDSDNVADVLQIRPHTLVSEKESDNYETGVKPEYCRRCKNKPKRKCKRCCCRKCGVKEDLELTVLCDECGNWYHIYCLDPPLESPPNEDDDWYCPNCSNERHRFKHESRMRSRSEKRKKIGDESESKKKSQKPTCHCNNKEWRDLSKTDDTHVKEITFEVPAERDIWERVCKLYSSHEVLKIFVEVQDKNDSDVLVMNSSAEELIANDIQNQHLWQEAKESLVLGTKAYLEHIERLFTCSICCELMKSPITLSCKHSFCITCFFKSLTVNVYNCALCRTDVINTTHYIVNENLDKALQILFPKFPKK